MTRTISPRPPRLRVSQIIVKTVFAVADEHMVLLYGFVKKTRKTPKPDSDLAAWRLKEVAS